MYIKINVKRQNKTIVHRMNHLVSFVFAFIILRPAEALIGFDCGGPTMNHTTVSLLDLEECHPPGPEIKTTNKYVQLLQLSEYNHADIIQCQINIRRIIYYCGMHSHLSAVQNGLAEYMQEISRTSCQRLHDEGTLMIGGSVITGVLSNSTTHRTVGLAGSVGTDGTCSGTTYSDPYGTWTNVFVQATIEIKLRSRVAKVKINTGKIILPSGTVCNLAKTFCIDYDAGYTFWQPLPSDTCELRSYDVLYEGPAEKSEEESEEQHPIIYSLTTSEITFALAKTGEHHLCGYSLITTEHPRLFIIETSKGNPIIQRKPVSVDNLDIFTYINSKFVYVEKHVRKQITSMYRSIILQKCESENQILRNALSLVTLVPEEFAYIVTKKPGYIAVNAGEVIHILQCIPADVKVRKTEDCYNELPVTHNNETYFLTPKTRILTKFGTRRQCNGLLPTIYKVDEQWVKLTPSPMITTAPQKTKPISQLNWNYLTPTSLATSGIYTQSELQQLRDHIMFPAEKPAIVHEMARGVTNSGLSPNSISFDGLLDEHSLEKIAKSTMGRIWKGFIEFGSISAAILSIFIIFKFIKGLVDVMINGYTLHSVYGCGIHILGAMFSSITHLLVHLGRSPPSSSTETTTTAATGSRESNSEDPDPSSTVINLQKLKAYCSQ